MQLNIDAVYEVSGHQKGKNNFCKQCGYMRKQRLQIPLSTSSKKTVLFFSTNTRKLQN